MFKKKRYIIGGLILVVVLGLWAEPLVQIAYDTSHWLAGPAGYIQAVLGG